MCYVVLPSVLFEVSIPLIGHRILIGSCSWWEDRSYINLQHLHLSSKSEQQKDYKATISIFKEILIFWICSIHFLKIKSESQSVNKKLFWHPLSSYPFSHKKAFLMSSIKSKVLFMFKRPSYSGQLNDKRLQHQTLGEPLVSLLLVWCLCISPYILSGRG